MAEQENKQVLQKGKSYITVVGRAKVGEHTFSGNQTSKTSDYQYNRVNIGVETSEGNIIYGEAMGGFSPSMNYPIKARTKEGENVDINWSDRFNESVIDTLNSFSTFNVGLVRDGDAPQEGEEDKRRLVVKKFLSSYDAHDYIKEHLKDGMMIMVKGSYSFSTYKDESQRKFQISDIYLSRSEEGFANFVQTVVLDQDSISKDSVKSAKETGEIVINARAVDYVGKINGKKVGKNMLFDLPITVKVNQEDPSITEKILASLFKVKKGKVREITLEGQIFEGYEQQQVNEKDIQISKDVQELIAMGLYSKEEAMEKMTVRGNKVSKLVFTRPFILKDKDDATKIRMDFSDDKYTPEDLIVEIPEEGEGAIDLGSTLGTEETSNDTGDNAWLSSLGLGE
jgi:hypothetical protein